MVAQGWEWREGLTTKGQEGIFGGDGIVLYLDCGSGYTTTYICQNLWCYTLKR